MLALATVLWHIWEARWYSLPTLKLQRPGLKACTSPASSKRGSLFLSGHICSAQGNIHEAWRLRGSSGVISLQPAIQVAWTPSVGHRNMAHVHDRCLPRNWQHAMAMGERSLDKVQILAQGRVGKWGKLVLGCTVGQLYCKSARICQGAKKWACVAAPSLSARWLRVGEEGYTIRAQLGQEREGERSEVGVTLQNGTDECHDLPFVVHLHSEIHPLRKWRELGY
mmetsp:Transcript_20989/g.53687  ORF Transcript_20989/g.53687 Transcript_20989/m.53687 type:complete len:224 (-) Transcript_20989:206-877(-)